MRESDAPSAAYSLMDYRSTSQRWNQRDVKLLLDDISPHDFCVDNLMVRDQYGSSYTRTPLRMILESGREKLINTVLDLFEDDESEFPFNEFNTVYDEHPLNVVIKQIENSHSRTNSMGQRERTRYYRVLERLLALNANHATYNYGDAFSSPTVPRRPPGLRPWGISSHHGDDAEEIQAIFSAHFAVELASEVHNPRTELRERIQSVIEEGGPEHVALCTVINDCMQFLYMMKIHLTQQGGERHSELLLDFLSVESSFQEVAKALDNAGDIHRAGNALHTVGIAVDQLLLPMSMRRAGINGMAPVRDYEDQKNKWETAQDDLESELRSIASELFHCRTIEEVYGLIRRWSVYHPLPEELTYLKRGAWHSVVDSEDFESSVDDEDPITVECATNSDTLIKAGAELRNCLGHHYHLPCLHGVSHIVLLRQGDTYLSAIELCFYDTDTVGERSMDTISLPDGRSALVMQHYGEENDPPSEEAERVYGEWKKKVERGDIVLCTEETGETEESKELRKAKDVHPMNLAVGSEVTDEYLAQVWKYLCSVKGDKWNGEEWVYARRRRLIPKEFATYDDWAKERDIYARLTRFQVNQSTTIWEIAGLDRTDTLTADVEGEQGELEEWDELDEQSESNVGHHISHPRGGGEDDDGWHGEREYDEEEYGEDDSYTGDDDVDNLYDELM